MSIFNQMIHGVNANECYPANSPETRLAKPRTFKETIQDQIVYHKSKIADLEAVRDSLTPEVENFVEAIQKLG